jgi:GNAT superfamily N-acetyltransferase
VKAKCFGCDSEIDAADVEGLVRAFVAHGRDQHTWSYPDEAIANYARNYAEATVRLTGDTERLPEIGEVTVHPVTEDRIDNWLGLFDHDGFAGNPDWASCYCLEPHEPPTPEMLERPWHSTREMMIGRLRDGTTFGYLAYADGRAVGWVNASFRSQYGHVQLIDSDGPDPQSVIGVSCFVIAPPYRRHGVASALLERVISDASQRGASWIEAYPRHEPKPADASQFRGPRSLYEAHGFEPSKVRKDDTVMRRRVNSQT